MSALSLEQAIENIYASVNNDNEDLETHIVALKAALNGVKAIELDPSRLVYNNREGRKLMQSFFKKRGITISFKAKTA